MVIESEFVGAESKKMQVEIESCSVFFFASSGSFHTGVHVSRSNVIRLVWNGHARSEGGSAAG